MFKFNLDPAKKYTLSKNSEIDLDFTYTQYAQRAFVKTVADGSSLVYPVGGSKPEGLWYAFGRGWIDYKNANDRGTDDSQLCPLFELEVDTSRFVKLVSVADITEFNDKYSVQDIVADYSDTTINWLKVAAEYDGIELSPYYNRLQCDFHWYKTYDIASGCIWNLKTIKNIVRINKNAE